MGKAVEEICGTPQRRRSSFESECRLRVHLISGRQFINKKGHRVNVFARISLLDSQSTPHAKLDEATSSLQMWTRAPFWDQSFELGPISEETACLHIACYHRRTLNALHMEGHKKHEENMIGEILLPISALFVEASVIDGDLVGWHTLDSSRNSGGGGELKLGLRLLNPEFLKDKETVTEDGESSSEIARPPFLPPTSFYPQPPAHEGVSTTSSK